MCAPVASSVGRCQMSAVSLCFIRRLFHSPAVSCSANHVIRQPFHWPAVSFASCSLISCFIGRPHCPAVFLQPLYRSAVSLLGAVVGEPLQRSEVIMFSRFGDEPCTNPPPRRSAVSLITRSIAQPFHSSICHSVSCVSRFIMRSFQCTTVSFVSRFSCSAVPSSAVSRFKRFIADGFHS